MPFQHSVKVPRLYKLAAKYAEEVQNGVNLKQLVYEKKHPNVKALYALVSLYFKYKDVIKKLIKHSKIIDKEPRLDPWLTKILMTELLWGKKKLGGQSKPIQAILRYEQSFKEYLCNFQKTIPDNDEDCSFQKPRYVRINTIKMDVTDALNMFSNEDWLLRKRCTNYSKFLKNTRQLKSNEFLLDFHVPNLLIFPAKTEFHQHFAWKEGCLFLQDKASCLPVFLLNPPSGSTVLDMCAAPGMKTTQIAAALRNTGKIYAVERDPIRFKTLNKMIQLSGATCVETFNEDVLKCNPDMFQNSEYILVDPSCSGSGMSDRIETGTVQDENRLENLSAFQVKILRRALTKFPSAKKIVYSTCSVHPQENEEVVKQVLETNSLYKLVPATKYITQDWHNFGSTEYGNIGKYCMYARQDDYTNGFFIAIFERLERGESNEFFKPKQT